MDRYFYELSVKTNFYDFFKDFVFDLGIDCVEEIDKNLFIIRDNGDLSEVIFGLNEYKKALSKAFKTEILLELKLEKKENCDWINEYKKSIKPVLIGNFYIRPSWENEKKDCENIIIDPALAFGSGHHESTKMCVEFLQKYIKDKENLLDIGCGSGILSICAAKLKAKVSSCDTDELAVKSTQQNAKINKIKLDEIWCGSTNFAIKNSKKYNVIVANIVADVILILKKDLINLLEFGGIIILSGILSKYKNDIETNFSSLKLLEFKQDGEWMSFIYKG